MCSVRAEPGQVQAVRDSLCISAAAYIQTTREQLLIIECYNITLLLKEKLNLSKYQHALILPAGSKKIHIPRLAT